MGFSLTKTYSADTMCDIISYSQFNHMGSWYYRRGHGFSDLSDTDFNNHLSELGRLYRYSFRLNEGVAVPEALILKFNRCVAAVGSRGGPSGADEHVSFSGTRFSGEEAFRRERALVREAARNEAAATAPAATPESQASENDDG